MMPKVSRFSSSCLTGATGVARRVGRLVNKLVYQVSHPSYIGVADFAREMDLHQLDIK